MNNAYLDMAKKVIPDPQILSVVAAKRARQLALGARPMVKCDSENHLDVALLEIGRNLIGYEFGSEDPVEEDSAAAGEAGAEAPKPDDSGLDA